VIGTLGALAIIPRWLDRPSYGPRLRPGELRASVASSRAARAYWAAEEAASRGNCETADKAWATGEWYRMQAAERQQRGDQTGGDLRPAVRNARSEIRRCRRA
jgi:hypothetical protein